MYAELCMSTSWVTPKWLADQLTVRASTIRRWIESGEVRAYRVGTRWRIPREVADELLRRSGVSQDTEGSP